MPVTMSLAVSRKRDRVQEFERLCRAHNLSLTVQRRAVFETLLEGPQHVSADAIHQAVQAKIPGLSKTTVYRALDTLVDIGAARKIYQPGAPALFESGTHPHHHLACSTCGKVIDVDIDELSLPTLQPDQAQGFKITEAHVFLRGTCPECLGDRNKSRASTSTRSAKTTAQRASCVTLKPVEHGATDRRHSCDVEEDRPSAGTTKE